MLKEAIKGVRYDTSLKSFRFGGNKLHHGVE